MVCVAVDLARALVAELVPDVIETGDPWFTGPFGPIWRKAASLPGLDRAEALLAALGVTEVTYILVPDFHAIAPIVDDESFARWIHQPRGFTVEWARHGYYHLEVGESRPLRTGEWLKRRLLTDHEGECLALRSECLRDRLARGRGVFERVVGGPPRTFVAPAWLFGDDLTPVLAAEGFQYTEDRRRVYDLRTHQARECYAGLFR